MSENKTSRHQGVEWMKLIAIIAIALQHTSENDTLVPIVRLTHCAVPIFVLVSCWFAYESGLRQTDARTMFRNGGRRFMHLYGLFLIWNFLILMMRLANDLFVSKTHTISLNMDGLFLTGYGNALWFLPFIAISNFLCHCVGYWARKSQVRLVVSAIVALSMATYQMFWDGHGRIELSNYFLGYSRKAIPSVLLVIAFRNLWLLMPGLLPVVTKRLMVSIGCIAFTAWGLLVYGRDIYAWETMLGVGITVLVSCAPRSVLRPLDPNLGLWIYLSHAPAIQTIKDLLPFAKTSWPAQSAILELMAFVGFMVLLVIGFFILGRMPWLKRILLLSGGFKSNRSTAS